MFEIQLEDIQLRGKIALPSRDRVRLTIEYPNDDRYRRIVQECLSDLLRPHPRLLQPASSAESTTPQPPEQSTPPEVVEDAA